MGQRVEHDVDTEGVSMLFRDLAEIPRITLFLLPSVTKIIIEADQHHHTATPIIHGPETRRCRIIADFIPHVRAAMLTHLRPINIAMNLRWGGQIIDAVKEGMLWFQFYKITIRPDLLE